MPDGVDLVHLSAVPIVPFISLEVRTYVYRMDASIIQYYCNVLRVLQWNGLNCEVNVNLRCRFDHK